MLFFYKKSGVKIIYTYKDPTLFEYLDPMIQLINHEGMDSKSFRALFKQTKDECSFNVTSNQFKRIKHYLLTLSTSKSEPWSNPLFAALCLNQWTAHEKEEAASAEYLSEVSEFYNNAASVKHTRTKIVATSEIKLFESDIKKIVIAEYHGTTAPLELLKANIKGLAKEHAMISIEGLSLEEIEEINHCNEAHTCSLLLYMLIPVERSLSRESVALAKRQLISSFISEGIQLIPGDNKYSVNLPAGEQRLRLYNYSAIQNVSTMAHKGPIVFWVGKAHAVETEGCLGIASMVGATLIDLTDNAPLISKPLFSKETAFEVKCIEAPAQISNIVEPPETKTPKSKTEISNQESSEDINFLYSIYFAHPNACKDIFVGLILAIVVISSIVTLGTSTAIAAGVALGFSGACATYASTVATTATTSLLIEGCTFFSGKQSLTENDNKANINLFSTSPN